MSFRIYYGDGSVYEGDDPTKAPKFDVQIIAQPASGVGIETLHYFDYYVFFESTGKWLGVYNTVALVDQVVHNIGDIKTVIVGRMIDHDTFTKILKRAREEAIGKSAKHAGEEPRG